MRWLHLVRHAPVEVDPMIPSSTWALASDDDTSVLKILDHLGSSRIRRVVTSQEAKARHTGLILASRLGLPMEIRDGLEEHHRGQVGFLDGEEFKAALTCFFARPNEVVFGDESADIALNCFGLAIRKIMDETNDDELVVSHGRVISLFVASVQRANPMEVWSSLEFPDHIPIKWPVQRLSSG